jgi:hypothetical protein
MKTAGNMFCSLGALGGPYNDMYNGNYNSDNNELETTIIMKRHKNQYTKTMENLIYNNNNNALKATIRIIVRKTEKQYTMTMTMTN